MIIKKLTLFSVLFASLIFISFFPVFAADPVSVTDTPVIDESTSPGLINSRTGVSTPAVTDTFGIPRATATIGTIQVDFTLPGAGSFTTVTQTVVDTELDNGAPVTFLGGTGIDYTFSATNICNAGCTISFEFTTADLNAVGGGSAGSVSIFEDTEEDGTFVQLTTTVTGADPFTATATTTSSGTDYAAGIVGRVPGGGAGSGDLNAPSFSETFAEDEYPISIDGNNFKLTQLVNEVPTTIIETGKPVQVKILLFENQGPSNIAYIALYTNIEGNVIRGDGSDTGIIYEKGKEIVILDPNGLFAAVDVTSSEEGNKLALIFDITFAKELEKSDIIIKTWDTRRNSAQAIIADAWDIVKGPKKLPAVAKPEIEEVKVEVTEEPQIPDWIRSSAGWWAGGEIRDSDFINGIQYMIKENIMVIPDLPEAVEGIGGLVPDWVRNNAGWWADSLISDDDFVSGIKYLVEQGIIRV